MSAWIGPDGMTAGRVTNIQPLQRYSWRIVPENLEMPGQLEGVQNRIAGAFSNRRRLQRAGQ